MQEMETVYYAKLTRANMFVWTSTHTDSDKLWWHVNTGFIVLLMFLFGIIFVFILCVYYMTYSTYYPGCDTFIYKIILFLKKLMVPISCVNLINWYDNGILNWDYLFKFNIILLVIPWVPVMWWVSNNWFNKICMFTCANTILLHWDRWEIVMI